jgi:predicted Zn-dependent protease
MQVRVAGADTARERRTVYRTKARRGLPGAVALLAAGALAACQTVPVTGRRAFNLLSVEENASLGAEAYDQALAGATLVTSGPELAMVQRIMSRIVAAAAEDDPGYEWEVRLIDDPNTVNAYALPGGKMAVYTGILPVAGSEAGLAVVMGHEIGHVVAAHGAERMSHSLGVDIVFAALNVGDYESLARTAVTLAFELPYSREHESEADHIGLVYMARAGYDPREAPEFWKRMGALGGGAPPEWLSTHPSDETRVRDLEGWLPEALQEWQAAVGAGAPQ